MDEVGALSSTPPIPRVTYIAVDSTRQQFPARSSSRMIIGVKISCIANSIFQPGTPRCWRAT